MSLQRSILIRRALATLAVLLLLALAGQAEDASLDTVLARASEYAATFRQQLSGIVAEETYVQDTRTAMGMDVTVDGRGTRPTSHRELRSDFLMVRAEGTYLEFRDVFEVDGRRVRDRQERLARLFLSGDAGRDQIVQITEESARYNIGSVYRNINTPALPLVFLEERFRDRFTFKRVDATAPALVRGWTQGNRSSFVVSPETWVVDYQEAERRTIIQRHGTGGDVPARGRMWIDPQTGRVLMTELQVGDPLMQATIDVAYGADRIPGMLVPVEMRERYINNRDRVTITGTAVYGRIRRFGVEVDEKIPVIR